MARPVDDADDADAPWNCWNKHVSDFAYERMHTRAREPTTPFAETTGMYICTHCGSRRPLERGKVHKRCIRPVETTGAVHSDVLWVVETDITV